VALRKVKQTYLTIVRTYAHRGVLPEVIARFEAMVRACRSQEEMAQVVQALRDFELGLRKGTDAASLVIREDDPLGFDAYEKELLESC
jgi:hypothetical protein